MAHVTTGQIAELLALDSRCSGIRAEVQDFLRTIAAKRRVADSMGQDSIYYPMDLRQPPHCPAGLTVLTHEANCIVDPTEVALSIESTEAQSVGPTSGHDVRTALVSKPVLNANVLDFLLIPENHRYIPENWRGRNVFFWGTTYMTFLENKECVRFLKWGNHGWVSASRLLDHKWGSCDPAAVV